MASPRSANSSGETTKNSPGSESSVSDAAQSQAAPSQAAPRAKETKRTATVRVDACPVCGRGGEAVEVGIGPLKTKICLSCARTGYGLMRIFGVGIGSGGRRR